MIDLTPDPLARVCDRCRTELPVTSLACPSCGALVHRDKLQQLAHEADAARAAGDHAGARALWLETLALLPPTSEQYRVISGRVSDMAAARASSNQPATAVDGASTAAWWKRGAGAAGGMLLLFGGKLKFLLLGLTKVSTFASMFGFIAVYWAIHGWPLAVGIAASIYIHEMGHVAMLRRLGIQAGAPLFIPGVGALVMLKEHVTDPVTDARIGLAGPTWGLGAAVASWVLYLATGAPIWRAIAELTGFLNLFNLIPIWQLDGSRGFHALSRGERWIVAAVVGGVLLLTGVRVLWLVGAVAVFRAIREPGGPGHVDTLYRFVVLAAALAWFATAVA